MRNDRSLQKISHWIRYIEDRIVLRNLVLAFLILVFGTAIIMQILKIYTRHHQNLSVPDFSGLTLTEASEVAQKINLRIEIFDSVFLADHERGTIVEQHPRAGFKVKKNRKIFFTLNAVNPEKVGMPNLVDLTIKQATAKLESFGLHAGHITFVPNIAVNVVLEQKWNGQVISPGDSVVKGARIDLLLGKGLSDEPAAVPNLVGLTLEAARIVAFDRFLSVGASVYDQTITSDEDELRAIVFRQKPEPGPEITLLTGSYIDVWITLDSTKVPSFQSYDTLTWH